MNKKLVIKAELIFLRMDFSERVVELSPFPSLKEETSFFSHATKCTTIGPYGQSERSKHLDLTDNLKMSAKKKQQTENTQSPFHSLWATPSSENRKKKTQKTSYGSSLSLSAKHRPHFWCLKTQRRTSQCHFHHTL